MANAHFHVTPYHVGGERLATGRIHYITRQEAYAPDAKARILHQGMTAQAARVREDLVEWNHANLPAFAENDPVRYFRAAEMRERKGKAPCYEEWRFSLPKELALPEQQAAAHAVLQSAFGTSHPYVYAIHNPRTVDDTMDQVHCHVIFSRRVNDGIERSEAQWFRQYKTQAPEQGGAQRSKRFGHLHSVKADRILYCDTMNVYLEAVGEEARLHPDTLESRGFEREPEPRGKPSDSNKARYHNEMTAAWQDVLAHRAAHVADKIIEAAQAQEAWEARKAQLGITTDMALDGRLARIRAAREQAVTQAPGRQVSADLAKEAHALEQVIRVHEAEVQLYTRMAGYGQGGRGKAVASPRGTAQAEEEVMGVGLRMTLYEQERDGYGRG